VNHRDQLTTWPVVNTWAWLWFLSRGNTDL
jgi:hypothetical protein